MTIADEIAKLVGEPAPRTSTHQATVLRTDNDGTTWVHIPGGADETPIHSTTAEARPGDTVTVTIANGRAAIDGNATSPAATTRTVGVAQQTADTAQLTASDAADAAASAIEDAALARTAAASAQASADEAADAATAAGTAAGNAQVAANAATFALSDVEKVVGTLEWIAEHGEYELTEDTAVVAGKVYYTRSGTSPNYTYTVVAEPKTSDIATYYELHLDESVQNFIASHLWLDSYGLNLSVNGVNGYRIHQGTVDGTKAMGTYVLDANGEVVALFGADGFQVGSSGESRMVGDYHSLRMVDKEGNGYLHVSDLRDATGTAEIIETVEKTSTSQTRYDLSCTVAGDDPTSSDPRDYDSIVVELWDGYAYTETGDYTLGYVGTSSVPYHYVIPGSWASSTQVRGIRATYLTSSEFAKAYTLGVRGDGQVGAMSFAHGSKCVASGAHSSAGGYISRAKGFASHASGSDSEASGFASHAFGVGLKSTRGGGLAAGWYNDVTNNPLFSLGNGTSDANRSNALELNSLGDMKLAGDLMCGTVNGVDVTAIPTPQSGVVATRSVAAGSSESVSITFSEEFAAAPNVVCGLQSTQTQLMGNCSCVVTARSTTGFTVALVNNSSSARNIGCYWIAM